MPKIAPTEAIFEVFPYDYEMTIFQIKIQKLVPQLVGPIYWFYIKVMIWCLINIGVQFYIFFFINLASNFRWSIFKFNNPFQWFKDMQILSFCPKFTLKNPVMWMQKWKWKCWFRAFWWKQRFLQLKGKPLLLLLSWKYCEDSSLQFFQEAEAKRHNFHITGNITATVCWNLLSPFC